MRDDTRRMCFASGPAVSPATPIFYTGDVIFAPTGTQFGRLERNGIASDWSSVKPFPNTFNAPAPDAYELFTVNAGIAPFLQITFRDRSGLLYPAAYRDSFNPVNFRIEVAPFSTIVLPINELSPGAGTGAQFSLLVEGFLDANFTPLPPGSDMLPEPASVVLVATGVLASDSTQAIEEIVDVPSSCPAVAHVVAS